MGAQQVITSPVAALLRCPVCHAPLEGFDDHYRCTNHVCATVYPVVDGVPILINEQASVFTLAEFVRRDDTYFAGEGHLLRLARRFLPDISRNVRGKENYAAFARAVLRASDAPLVLVVGGGIIGDGMEALLAHPAIRLVETDVALAPRTQIVCDAHDIPFDDGLFDGVVAQAVLEHVADPGRCADEIHRVLKPGGVVYAETPFMQQVHGGRYDFTRFTHLGHRRLFRRFAELDSGAVCGPGMALAWAFVYFWCSFAPTRPVRRVLYLLSSLLAWPLKYFDYLLIRRPAALDAASGVFFLGTKSDRALSDRELITEYRGAL